MGEWMQRWGKRLPWRMRAAAQLSAHQQALSAHRNELDALARELDSHRGVVRRHGLRINMMEDRMTSSEQAEAQANDKFAAMLGTAIAEIRSLRDGQETFAVQLAQAVADGDKARADALAADALRDAERINNYAAQLAELYPAQVPEVQVPDAGAPAEPPADSGVEVPAVEEPQVDVPVVESGTGESGEVSTGDDAAIVTPDAEQPS